MGTLAAQQDPSLVGRGGPQGPPPRWVVGAALAGNSFASVRAVPPIRVAIVAPSQRILGGQSVQAQRLLDGWRNDPEVEAWLVPINPEPPHPLRLLLEKKYVRTVLTQMWYWPLLVRELRHADVVHVFSA